MFFTIERHHLKRSRFPCPGSSGVEQWIENPRVGGSIPPPGTTFPANKSKKAQENKGFALHWDHFWDRFVDHFKS